MNTFPRSGEGKKKCLAQAVFDNLAETPDELAFRRGDTLTVLEQDTDGLEGWWLCSLRGRQGICPGNRLQILHGKFDTIQGGKLAAQLHASPGRHRRSWSPSHAKTSPMSQSTTSLPQDRLERQSQQYSPETYDTPPSPVSVGVGPLPGQAEYDTPRPLRMPPAPPPASAKPARTAAAVLPPAAGQATYQSPRSLASQGPSAAANRCSSLSTTSAGSSVRSSSSGSSSNRSSLEPAPEPATGRRPPRIPENAPFAAPRQSDAEDYDVPRSHRTSFATPPSDAGRAGAGAAPAPRARVDSGETYDVPPPPVARLAELDVYDSPRPLAETEAEYDSPNDMLDMLDAYDSVGPAREPVQPPPAALDIYDSPRAGLDIYDSPRAALDAVDSPQRTATLRQGSRDSLQSTANSNRISAVSDTSGGTDESEVIFRTERARGSQTVSRNATYWLRNAGGESSLSLSRLGELRELPLDTEAGLETVQRLEQELTATVARLFTFVVPGWRGAAHMEACAVDLKLTVLRMRSALRELVQFAYGAMVATARGPEQSLGARFVQVLRPLEESVRLIESAATTQEETGWTAEALCRPQGAPADALDQLLACAQSLGGDARQLTAFVRGNAALIFRRRVDDEPAGRASPSGPRSGLMGDYDYVCLQTRDSLEQEGDEVRSRLDEGLRGSFDCLMKQSQVPVSSRGSRVSANDQQVLEFYRDQTECHHEFLNNAIDAFFQTIQNNQPPKVFVAHSKFVILSAHKLVYIGDTVHRNVVNGTVRRKALAASDALFASLKRTVQATKTAALQFPSARAVQQMADDVLDVSRAAGGLKLALDEAAL